MIKLWQLFNLMREVLSLLDENKDLVEQVKALALELYDLAKPLFTNDDGIVVMSAPNPEAMEAAIAGKPEPVKNLFRFLRDNPRAGGPVLDMLKKLLENPEKYAWLIQLLLVFV